MKSSLRHFLPLLAVAAVVPALQADTKELRVLAQAGGGATEKVERHVTVRQMGGPAAMEKVPFLGVATGPVSATLCAQLGLVPGAGLVVNQIVPASPAAGVLAPHDILVKLDDQLLIETNQLAVLVRSHKEGDEVTVTYLRGGKQATAKLKLVLHDVPKFSMSSGATWPTNGTISISGGESPAGSVGRQEVDRVLAMIDAQRVPEQGSGPNVRVMKVNPNNSTMVLSDDEGSIEITTKDGIKNLVAKDPKGAEICAGPITTIREQEALPPRVLERLKKLEGLQDFQFKTGEDFKGGEVKVITPPARKISAPQESRTPSRRVQAF